MIKNIFIATIDGASTLPADIKGFAEDLKYAVKLKFTEDKVRFTEENESVDVCIRIIPKGKKQETISPDSKNFVVNFNPEIEPIRNRYFYDLSVRKKGADLTERDKSYWNTITDIIFQLDEEHGKENGQIVFVAETSFDQVENRRAIVRELEQSGYKIVPDHSIGKDAGKEIQEALTKANFSVHIIGEEAVEIDKGEDQDLVFYQNELASAFSAKNTDFNRYIYIPSHISPPKSQQVKIEKVKRKPDNLHGAEIIECGIEKFKSELFQKIRQNNSKEEVVDMQGNLIYIINGINFKTETKAIRKQLEDSSIDLVAIDSFDDSLDFLHQHKRNLLMASSVLIINSESNDHWLSSMLDDILKSYGLGKQKPFDLVGIITEKKLQYFSQLELIHTMEIDDSTKSPKTENLKLFLKAVKDARD